MKFILLINVKMPTIVDILTSISRINCYLYIDLFLKMPSILAIYEQFKLSMKKSFIISGPNTLTGQGMTLLTAIILSVGQVETVFR